MARRIFKLASVTSTVLVASGIYLDKAGYLNMNDVSGIRAGRAVFTTAVIAYDYLTSLWGVTYGTEDYWDVKSKVHLRSAERLRDLCCANRGTYIKVGQHLGALDYLLPEEYTSTLKILHSQAPQSSMQEIQQVIREDLGKERKYPNKPAFVRRQSHSPLNSKKGGKRVSPAMAIQTSGPQKSSFRDKPGAV
ncbi:aarF domain-containing protein kinase 1-like [Protopterus annectens]|uniref:aarF domain-containing protein kinase 1-like n=1 Tax=Protopterus annectens TaxID=7888 RepID=UPI001CFB701C|nr:aarF domain-containing protein kinase 1-like [Protopterus annectens]